MHMPTIFTLFAWYINMCVGGGPGVGVGVGVGVPSKYDWKKMVKMAV